MISRNDGVVCGFFEKISSQRWAINYLSLTSLFIVRREVAWGRIAPEVYDSINIK